MNFLGIIIIVLLINIKIIELLFLQIKLQGVFFSLLLVNTDKCFRVQCIYFIDNVLQCICIITIILIDFSEYYVKVFFEFCLQKQLHKVFLFGVLRDLNFNILIVAFYLIIFLTLMVKCLKVRLFLAEYCVCVFLFFCFVKYHREYWYFSFYKNNC